MEQKNKNLVIYAAGVLTTPAAALIFRKRIVGTLAWAIASPDMDEKWEKIVERRAKMREVIVAKKDEETPQEG